MNELKAKLHKGELTLGSWLTTSHPATVEIMASAGFEWLVVDLEHTAIELKDAMYLIPLIQAAGMKALVRVSKNEEVVIKRVLDLGADGIIVPMVNSAEDAQRAVDYAHYPNIGRRGAGLYRAQKYGMGFQDYVEWSAEELIIIAQVEHIESVNHLEAILDNPRIDGTIVGPFDLSASLNKPGRYNEPEVVRAIERIEEVCKARKKPLGFHVIPPDYREIKNRIDKGYSFLAFSLDTLFLGEKVRSEMGALRKDLSNE